MGEDIQLDHELEHHIRQCHCAILPILGAVVRDEDGASLDGDVLELDVAHLIGPDEAVVQDIAGQQVVLIGLQEVAPELGHCIRRQHCAILLAGSLATECLQAGRWIRIHKAVREEPLAEGPDPSDIIVPGTDREALIQPQPVHKPAKEPCIELVHISDWRGL